MTRVGMISARRGRGFAAALVLLALAACGGASVPQETYYRLAAVEAPARAGGPLRGTVEVAPFRADGLLNDRALVYRDSPTTLAAYSYHFWWTAPATLLQQSLVDTLRRAEAFELVVTPELRLDRTYEVVGRVRRLEHATASVSVEIELMLRLARSGEPLLLKTYTEEIKTTDATVPAAIDAFSTAMSRIWTAFLGDLGTITPPAA